MQKNFIGNNLYFQRSENWIRKTKQKFKGYSEKTTTYQKTE